MSEAGVSADPNKVKAIKNFPVPNNISELKSFMGLVNQLGDFSKQVSSTSVPLRGLLSTKNVFRWNFEHQKAFEKTKEALCDTPILCHYEMYKPLLLQTDASRLNGLGFILMQK